MSMRRLQGFALIISSVLILIAYVGVGTNPTGLAVNIIAAVSCILFIVGLPAIISLQPMGTAGLVGIMLLEICTLVQLVTIILEIVGVTDLGPFVTPLGRLGRLASVTLLGVVTLRGKIIPKWVGWAWIIQFPLVLAYSITPLPIQTILALIGSLANPAAISGYGLVIIRRKTEFNLQPSERVQDSLRNELL